MRQGSSFTYLSGAVPCCVHSLFNPFQLASEPAETRFVGPSTLTNGPLFSPHFPWCFCRIPSHAPYFSEPSLRSPPLHQSSVFPHLRFLCRSPVPTRGPQHMLNSSLHLFLSVCLSLPFPTHHLSLCLSISLFLQMYPPVSSSYMSSRSQKHPHYFSTSPILLLNSQTIYPNPSTSTCISDSMSKDSTCSLPCCPLTCVSENGTYLVNQASSG